MKMMMMNSKNNDDNFSDDGDNDENTVIANVNAITVITITKKMMITMRITIRLHNQR